MNIHQEAIIVDEFKRRCLSYLTSAKAFYGTSPAVFGIEILIEGFLNDKKVLIKTDSYSLFHSLCWDNIIVPQIADQVKDLFICFE